MAGPPDRKKHANRESWLTAAIAEIGDRVFVPHGSELPDNIAVSCGWPGGGSIKKVMGQAWQPKASAGKRWEVFISPTLDNVVAEQGVLAVLVHELVHTAVGPECGHKGEFKDLAGRVGLEGKMKSTKAGAPLIATLTEIAGKLGPYPHYSVTKEDNPAKKQTARLIKAQCPECDYVVRVTRKHLSEKGYPLCPIHMVPFIAEGLENGDGEGQDE
jgi:hypothetical protein